MSIWEKCKALQIGKMRMFRLFLLIEGLLLVWGIFNLFGRDAVYEYGPEDMTVNFGNYDAETGCFIDESAGQQGNAVDFCEIALPKGVYSVSLHYETDTHMHNLCEVTDDTVGFKMMKTNMEHLYASLHQTDFNMWVLQGSKHLTAHAYYDGVGTLLVTGLTIRETNALYRIYLFWIVVFSLLWNGAYLYIQYDRKYQIPAIDKNVLFGLGVVLIFSSFLLMVDYSIPGGDLLYHLLRIEGIKDNLLAGQFPSRISPEWQQGYGYASPIFYGETLLYIGSFFRLIGFTVTTSYRLFFFVINILAIGISYYSFSKLFKDKYIGLLCTALYVLSVYRIYKMFVCGLFGEAFGMMFLPLLAYGFYQVFTGDIRDINYKKSLIPLVIGFSGILQSHFLTGELAGGVTICLCLFFWKKVFRKETFFVLAKTVIYSVLLSAWFLVPFADYMLTGDFVIHHV